MEDSFGYWHHRYGDSWDSMAGLKKELNEQRKYIDAWTY